MTKGDRPLFSAPVILALAALLFAVMAVIVKITASRLPGPEVAFVRFAVGIAVCALASTKIPMRSRNRIGLALRGAYGGAAVLCYFLAIAHLPVGVATLMNYTAPVFTAIYAALFLGEALKRSTVFALVLTTVGMVLVMIGSAPPGSLVIGPWQIVAFASAVLSGAAVATIREVRRTDGSWEIFLAFCVGGAAMTLVPTIAAWRTPTALEWVELVVVGLLSLAAQLMMTYSLRFVRAAASGVIIQLTPVAAMAIGWLFLGETMAGWAIVGALLTLSGVTWGILFAGAPEPVALEEP